MRGLHLIPILLLGLSVDAKAQDGVLPPLNGKVIEFVDAHMKKKVGRGECWDLAAEALQYAGASWDGKYKFGRRIDPAKEKVLPGDVVQFENVHAVDRTGNVQREERMTKHTAIIHHVHDDGIYTLAHQNTDLTGRKVGTSRFLMRSVVRGKVIIYRPVADQQ